MMTTWIEDPAHAWLAVSLTEHPDAMQYGTGYGYRDLDARMVYLEEDCEAPAFLTAHPELLALAGDGRIPVRLYADRDAPIRDLPHIPRKWDPSEGPHPSLAARDCPRCGHSRGSNYHEAACDPEGNREDRPPV